MFETGGDAQIGGVVLGSPQPFAEIRVGRQLGEVLAEFRDEIFPLPPRKVAKRGLDLADVLVGSHESMNFPRAPLIELHAVVPAASCLCPAAVAE